MTLGRAVLLALASLPAAATAVELRDIEVDYADGIYSVDSEVWFDAPRHAVYSVFSDWDLSEQFSSVIVEARDLGPDENGQRGFYVRNRACFLFFCKSTERRGRVEATPDTLLAATADPARSDFERSDERWTFRSEAGGTLVGYSLRMKPSFWVPPLIGPYVVKRKLKSDGIHVLERIERIAQDWQSDNG
jgi:Polyketide cyclase / dehydrase and lipid transport